jgi:hypothetical protein
MALLTISITVLSILPLKVPLTFALCAKFFLSVLTSLSAPCRKDGPFGIFYFKLSFRTTAHLPVPLLTSSRRYERLLCSPCPLCLVHVLVRCQSNRSCLISSFRPAIQSFKNVGVFVIRLPTVPLLTQTVRTSVGSRYNHGKETSRSLLS